LHYLTGLLGFGLMFGVFQPFRALQSLSALFEGRFFHVVSGFLVGLFATALGRWATGRRGRIAVSIGVGNLLMVPVLGIFLGLVYAYAYGWEALGALMAARWPLIVIFSGAAAVVNALSGFGLGAGAGRMLIFVFRFAPGTLRWLYGSAPSVQPNRRAFQVPMPPAVEGGMLRVIREGGLFWVDLLNAFDGGCPVDVWRVSCSDLDFTVVHRWREGLFILQGETIVGRSPQSIWSLPMSCSWSGVLHDANGVPVSVTITKRTLPSRAIMLEVGGIPWAAAPF
jgi:hypothetical protein